MIKLQQRDIRKILIPLYMFTCLSNLTAQTNHNIDDGGSVSTCSANLFDSNNAGNYGNGENFTITFCTNGGGNVINVGFAALFDIDPSDNLFVYDGNSIAAPLIGSYNNSNPPGGLSSTTTNTSGCLTFQFISDGATTAAGWEANFNCITKCQPIDAVITTTPALVNLGPDSNYTNICAGDAVTFNVTGTYPDNGANPFNYIQSDATSTYEWSLGTGSIVTTQSATETFTTPQGYLIELKITDANGCIEIERHKVRTGIPPIFNGVLVSPDTICLNESVNLLGGFNQTTPGIPSISSSTGNIAAGGIVSGQTFLPDGGGQAYTTDININGFSGQTIANGTDISKLCMNIEHSYIGDLDITLTCPNGTSIILMDGFNGIGPNGTFLGDADDNGLLNPGIGMDYCFDLGAVWGTMDFENNNNNWIASTVTPGNDILTPGDFQPEQSFTNLVGCPIDGNWTLTITDNIGADNGYIFEWGITLNPAINPNVEYYTPILLTGIWLPNADIYADYDTLALATPSASGNIPYIFEVTDDYGCNFDTTVIVNVIDNPLVTARTDTSACVGEFVPLNAEPTTTSNLPCDYTLRMSDTWGDGWNGFEVQIVINGISTNYTMATGSYFDQSFTVFDGDNIVINTISGIFDNEVSYEIIDCDSNVIFNDGFNFTGTSPIIGNGVFNFIGNSPPAIYNYNWTPTTDLSDPNIANPIFTANATTTFVVEMWDSLYQACSSFDTVIVTANPIAFIPGLDGDTILCRTHTNFDMFNVLKGTPDVGGTWVDTLGNLISNMFNPATDTSGIYAYFVGSGSCADTAFVTITNPDSVLITNTNSDSIICINGTAFLYANPSGGSGALSLIWDNALVGNGPHNTNPIVPTTYQVYAEDALGCISETETISITLLPPIFINPIESDTVCSVAPGNSTNLTVNASGGNGKGFIYEWHDGAGNIIGTDSTISITPISNPETYIVYVEDSCSTPQESMAVNVYWHPEIRPLFNVSITNDVCIPVEVIFTNTTDTLTVQNITWDFGDGNTSNLNPITPHTYTSAVSYDVTVTITSPEGCVKDSTIYNMVRAYDFPEAIFNSSPLNPNTNNPEVTFTNLSIDNDTNLWTFTSGSPDSTMIIDPVVTFPDSAAGTYPVQLIVANAAGCRDTTFGEFVKIEGVYLFYTPNSFSPNGDGLNEEFRAYGDAFDKNNFNMQIFDRWGELLFETNNIDNAWNGTFKGKDVPNGAYIWKTRVKEKYTTIIHNNSGHINLLR